MSSSRPKSSRRQAPFSLRLSEEERRALDAKANGEALGSFIKQALLDGTVKPRRRRNPIRDDRALAETLAALGASRIANNLNQLAHAANSGSLYFDPETKRAITRACDDVHAMRLMLMRALGYPLPDRKRPPESLSQTFARAACKPGDRS